jgi:tryptophan synthase beta chain
MKSILAANEAAALRKALIKGELPDERGRLPAFERLEEGVKKHLHSPEFQAEFQKELREWVGRPTAMTLAPRLSERWGTEVWLKREDLAHTGAHKINNAIGQALLAKRLGVERVIAETGAGQHGVASAAACARVGLPCSVYMGTVDIERQAPNVDRMHRLGAEVLPVETGDRTLRAAIDEAMREWVSDPAGIYYLLGSAVGAHPYPYLVRELQSVIGTEARHQMLDQAGSNAIGLFYPLLADDIELIGVEAGGTGDGLGQNAATLATGTAGVLQGCYSLILQNDDGQVQETHSISAGLDYSGVGPEHALLQAVDRVTYVTASDDEALAAVEELCEAEGILTALETAHAYAAAKRWSQEHPGKRILIGNSGRGDKDMPTLTKYAARARTHAAA